ncbi:MAG: toll/interleukin-1 receptor domain-containing protein [Phycisphaerales bacterium]|nr:toll/interleukin-1 receptor domain-containing protein [Phycisphaerales bacterium]
MANPEHVEIVKKGSEAIAKWREHHLSEHLDLREANLREANLYEANLSEADLRWADLSLADLRDASLNGANLSDADLRKAGLGGADLCLADLRGANLNGAYLYWANLKQANLSGADFNKAHQDFTTLGDVDLSDAKNLGTIVHDGPSIVGVDTLFKSKGRIPEAFLRGCGVPEVLIEYLPTLIGAMAPIQFYSCFISYSGKDDAFARRLHARLEAEKLRVWFAPEDMHGGEKSKDQIDRAIQMHERLLLVLSASSMNSTWVRHEIKRARQKERDGGREVLFPIGLVPHGEILKWECFDSDTGEDLAEKVREYHIPDFANWKQEDDFEKGFAALMRDLRRQDDPKPDSQKPAG